MVITTEVLACQQCGTPGQPVYNELRDRFFNAPGRWSVFGCERCGLLWLNPRPLPSETSKLYSDYYTHVIGSVSVARRVKQAIKRAILASRFGYTNLRNESLLLSLVGPVLGLLPSLRRKVEREVMYLRGERRGRLLDVGSGSGAFIAEMRRLGWAVCGVEPDPKGAQAARDALKCEVQTGTVHNATLQDGSFDAVTLCHVIEHVPDPVAVFQRCNALLKANGTLVVSTPNARSLGHRLFKDAWRELDPPRHFFVFTPETLRECVERAGFRVKALVTSSRNANQIWSTSRQIRQKGRMNPNAVQRRLRMEGLLFWFVERIFQFLSSRPVSEEITIIAEKA